MPPVMHRLMSNAVAAGNVQGAHAMLATLPVADQSEAIAALPSLAATLPDGFGSNPQWLDDGTGPVPAPAGYDPGAADMALLFSQGAVNLAPSEATIAASGWGAGWNSNAPAQYDPGAADQAALEAQGAVNLAPSEATIEATDWRNQ